MVSKGPYSPRFTVDKIDFQGNPLHNQMQEHPLAFRGALGNLGLNGGGLMSNNLLGNMQNQTWVITYYAKIDNGFEAISAPLANFR